MNIPAYVFSVTRYSKAKEFTQKSEPTPENRKRAGAAGKIGKRRNKFERLLRERYAAKNV